MEGCRKTIMSMNEILRRQKTPAQPYQPRSVIRTAFRMAKPTVCPNCPNRPIFGSRPREGRVVLSGSERQTRSTEIFFSSISNLGFLEHLGQTSALCGFLLRPNSSTQLVTLGRLDRRLHRRFSRGILARQRRRLNSTQQHDQKDRLAKPIKLARQLARRRFPSLHIAKRVS